jgi:phosphatidylinositol-3,4,5-trisphosphate 3-phosphatase/dual-specificity protein phosphatase PTEN
LFHSCRKAVSRTKRRYQENGFDLDLTYVTPRIIVHGFPATGLEHIYRNPRLEIRRLMDFYHKDKYKMYNFCCEPGRGYDPAIFYGRVERYPFKDHNTPPLETMAAFANSAKLWLDEDPQNVVNMHCKAGKGRAGLMCCVLLVRTGAAQSAKEALEQYDRKRVINNKGLTVTSQRKFVIFYEALWRKFWNIKEDIGKIPGERIDSTVWTVPSQPELHLLGIELVNANPKKITKLRVKVFKGTNFKPITLFDSGKGTKGITAFNCDCVIQGNFKVLIQQPKGILGKYKKLFELWHNTLFMNR